MSRRLILVALAVVALAFVPGRAMADDPIITDPAGDTIPAPCVVFTYPVQSDTCGTKIPVSPERALDIVEGDLTTAARDLVVSMRVVDIDAPELRDGVRDKRTYALWGSTPDSAITFLLDRRTGKPDVAQVVLVHLAGNSLPAIATVPAVVNPVTDTITWTVPLATLNAMQDEACGTCASIRNGTVFADIHANTRVFVDTGVYAVDAGLGDSAQASRDYVIGAR